MKQKLLITITFFISTLACYTAQAEELSFTAEAPNAVVMGETFRLSYTINTHKAKGFRVGNITDFDILMGPNQSSSSSTSIINGVRTSSRTLTFTCILRPKKEGTYTIPAATITADGKQMTSKELTIKVLPPDQRSTSSQQTTTQTGRGGSASQTGKFSDDDLFIVATVNKKKVYEQEAILLTYKIYTTLNLTNVSGKMPDLKGFHTQEVEMPKGNREFQLEHYKGRNYRTIVWSQYILFPQQSGKLEIPSISFEGTIAQRVQSYDPFDAFFNGGSYVNVQKTIRTPKLTIDVSPLPSGKPASYSGGVGSFSISSSISATELKENEAVTLKLIISGTGNMKLLKTPEIEFPADFDVYDPKVDNKFTLKTSGQSGNKVIEYLAIPRYGGIYTIPAVEFSYFDVKSGEYKTLKTPEYTLNVAKGTNSGGSAPVGYVSKEELRLLGQDIRYINLNDAQYRQRGQYLYGTAKYWLWYIIPLVAFVLLTIIYRKQAIENANIAKMKTKKAGKVATRRLKIAKKKMIEKDKAGFYDELLKALWGYLSDKLSMPVSELSKDNIAAKLVEYNVPENLIGECTSIIGECEFARYAPTLSGYSDDTIYNQVATLMNNLENAIKR